MTILFQIIFSLIFYQSQAATFDFQKEVGSTVFKAKALGLKFEGKGTGPTGQIEIVDQARGELEVDLDSLKTGIGIRDGHMKDNYLETKKFPKAKLKIESVEGFNVSSPDGTYNFKGKLIVRGIEKTIMNPKVVIKKTSSGFQVEAQFDTKISDFEIPIPKHAGLVLKNDIQVVVKTSASERKL